MIKCDKPGNVDPFFENASIKPETPKHFQFDNLYKIAVTEVVYEHHFVENSWHQVTLVKLFKVGGASWPSTKSDSPNLIHC